jgi:hypothetical protein
MSALELVRINKGFRGWCVNGCKGQFGIRSGTHKAFIAGYPVGVLCHRCTPIWRAAWNGANITLRVQVNPFKGIYILENPEVVESAMFGSCLKGRFRMEDDPSGMWDEGIFRMDRMNLIEPLDEQLQVAA